MCDSRELKNFYAQNTIIIITYPPRVSVFTCWCERRGCFIRLICRDCSCEHGNHGYYKHIFIGLGFSEVDHCRSIRICWIFLSFLWLQPCNSSTTVPSLTYVYAAPKLLFVRSLDSFSGRFGLIVWLMMSQIATCRILSLEMSIIHYHHYFYCSLLEPEAACGLPLCTQFPMSAERRVSIRSVFLQTNLPHYWIISFHLMMRLDRLITLITTSWSLMMESEQYVSACFGYWLKGWTTSIKKGLIQRVNFELLNSTKDLPRLLLHQKHLGCPFTVNCNLSVPETALWSLELLNVLMCCLKSKVSVERHVFPQHKLVACHGSYSVYKVLLIPVSFSQCFQLSTSVNIVYLYFVLQLFSLISVNTISMLMDLLKWFIGRQSVHCDEEMTTYCSFAAVAGRENILSSLITF